MDDRELLEAYARNRSESAFSELVRRHLAWVYSVALRNTGNQALAKDIAQSVFVLLAKKAGSLRSGTALGGWLFRTTRFVANRALRAEKRRKNREEAAASMIAPTPFSDENQAVWKQLEPYLDQAVAALPEPDRQAILLRFYEKLPLLEIGRHLGVSEEAAKKRVSRAIDKMRDFLVRRDVAFGGTLLAGLMAEHTVHAVPAAFVASVSNAAAFGFSSSTVLPTLAQETMNAWRWTRLKIAAGTTLSLCGLAWLYFALAPQTPPVISNPPASPANVQPAVEQALKVVADPPPAPAAPTNPPIRPDERMIHFRVVVRDSGEPVSGAPLAVSTVTKEGWKERFDLSTDKNGSADIPYPTNTGRLDIGVVASGWEARFATWRLDSDPEIPADYTLRVGRITNVMSGWIKDDQGQPVADAIVEMDFGISDMAQQENPRERLGFPRTVPVARSDQNGWWTCALVDPNRPVAPPRARHMPNLQVQHPDFALTKIKPADSNLWNGTLVTTLNRSVTFTGRIVAEAGTPVGGAWIAHEPASFEPISTNADAQGWFAIQGLPPGTFDFIVTAPGFAQDYTNVNLKAGMEPVEIRLKPGATLHLRLVDEDGNAISNATVAATGPVGIYQPGIYWKAESGPDGRVEWTSASADKWVNICASKSPEFAMSQVFLKKVDDAEHVIRLRHALAITGRVTDARTGQLIQQEIKAFPGYDGFGDGTNGWFRGDTWRSTNGTFQVRFNEGSRHWRFSIEAEGYSPFVSDWLDPDSSKVLDVRLQPMDPANP